MLRPDPSSPSQDRVLGTVQSVVAGLVEKLSKVESELRQRGLAEVSTPQLYSAPRDCFSSPNVFGEETQRGNCTGAAFANRQANPTGFAAGSSGRAYRRPWGG